VHRVICITGGSTDNLSFSLSLSPSVSLHSSVCCSHIQAPFSRRHVTQAALSSQLFASIRTSSMHFQVERERKRERAWVSE
jgi:hypothetical protein